MRRLVIGAVGLLAGALAVEVAGAGCSCPPGYRAQPVSPGTWVLRPDDAGIQDTNYLFVVAGDQKAITETFERNGVKYENQYRITGPRP